MIGLLLKDASIQQRLNYAQDPAGLLVMNNIVTPDHLRQLRHIFYFGIPVLFFAVVNLLAEATFVREIVEEKGFVEVLQTLLAVTSVVLLLGYARSFPGQRAFLGLAALLGGLAVIREENNSDWYRQVFFMNGSSALFGAMVLGTFCFVQRKGIFKQIWQAVAWPSFLFLLGGGIIVIGWAQTLAQQALFIERLDDRVVEECLETAGYFFILCGVIELYFDLRRAAGCFVATLPGLTDARATRCPMISRGNPQALHR